MIYLKLLFSFIKIGLFSFGGGYAMIPMIQQEIEAHGWLTVAEFVDIIAISEMTPGPIAVNSATFVGYKAAGLLGSIAATVGVALPSLVLVMIISRYFFKFQGSTISTMIFYGVRPAVVSLIAAACFFVAETAIFKKGISLGILNEFFNNPVEFIDFGGILILLAALVALVKFKIHPIFVIVGAGVAGIVIYYFIPV
jgi:chromate transporter